LQRFNDHAFMQKIGNILGHFDKNVGPLLRVRQVWPEVAGDILTQHVKPVRIKQASLEVLCDAPAYVQQVELFADELLVRVNKACRLKLKRLDAKFGYCSGQARGYEPPRRQVRRLEIDPADVARIKSPALRSVFEDMLKK